MRNVLLVLFGVGMLIAESSIATLGPLHLAAPNPLLPIAIYFGVHHEVHVVRGALLTFILGYLLDVFSGNPLGLHTFLLVATYILSRLAGLRLFMRGKLFQGVLTFVVGLLLGGASLALRAIFEQPAPFPFDSTGGTVLRVLLSAVSTAALAPLVFAVLRRIEGDYGNEGRRRTEAPA